MKENIREQINVLVAGGFGKMGQEVLTMLMNSEELKLVAVVDTAIKSEYSLPKDVLIGQDLGEMIKKAKPNVMVDFTLPEFAFSNTVTALKEKVSVVMGTTGLIDHDLDKIDSLAKENGAGVVVAPNFALGAILMMEISKQIAKHFTQVEIIEMHNPKKADSPSGTALKTAKDIAPNLKSEPVIYDTSPARGDIVNNIPIHSVRLTGLIAHQQVIFGAPGQTLTIKHDSYDRTCFMPGVALAVKKVVDIKGLVFGLEHLLDL